MIYITLLGNNITAISAIWFSNDLITSGCI